MKNLFKYFLMVNIILSKIKDKKRKKLHCSYKVAVEVFVTWKTFFKNKLEKICFGAENPLYIT